MDDDEVARRAAIRTKFEGMYGPEFREIITDVVAQCDYNEEAVRKALMEMVGPPLSEDDAGKNDQNHPRSFISAQSASDTDERGSPVLPSAMQARPDSNGSSAAPHPPADRADSLSASSHSATPSSASYAALASRPAERRKEQLPGSSDGQLRDRTIILLRGLPGSGKSTLTRHLMETYPDAVVCSADDFFVRNGRYAFDSSMLGDAHQACQDKARRAMQDKVQAIIIDNTNTTSKEMLPYVNMAEQYGYNIEIRQPDTPWAFDVLELAKRNRHGVSEDKIAMMADRFQHDVTVKSLRDLAKRRSRPAARSPSSSRVLGRGAGRQGQGFVASSAPSPAPGGMASSWNAAAPPALHLEQYLQACRWQLHRIAEQEQRRSLHVNPSTVREQLDGFVSEQSRTLRQAAERIQQYHAQVLGTVRANSQTSQVAPSTGLWHRESASSQTRARSPLSGQREYESLYPTGGRSSQRLLDRDGRTVGADDSEEVGSHASDMTFVNAGLRNDFERIADAIDVPEVKQNSTDTGVDEDDDRQLRTALQQLSLFTHEPFIPLERYDFVMDSLARVDQAKRYTAEGSLKHQCDDVLRAVDPHVQTLRQAHELNSRITNELEQLTTDSTHESWQFVRQLLSEAEAFEALREQRRAHQEVLNTLQRESLIEQQRKTAGTQITETSLNGPTLSSSARTRSSEETTPSDQQGDAAKLDFLIECFPSLSPSFCDEVLQQHSGDVHRTVAALFELSSNTVYDDQERKSARSDSKSASTGGDLPSTDDEDDNNDDGGDDKGPISPVDDPSLLSSEDKALLLQDLFPRQSLKTCRSLLVQCNGDLSDAADRLFVRQERKDQIASDIDAISIDDAKFASAFADSKRGQAQTDALASIGSSSADDAGMNKLRKDFQREARQKLKAQFPQLSSNKIKVALQQSVTVEQAAALLQHQLEQMDAFHASHKSQSQAPSFASIMREQEQERRLEEAIRDKSVEEQSSVRLAVQRLQIDFPGFSRQELLRIMSKHGYSAASTRSFLEKRKRQSSPAHDVVATGFDASVTYPVADRDPSSSATGQDQTSQDVALDEHNLEHLSHQEAYFYFRRRARMLSSMQHSYLNKATAAFQRGDGHTASFYAAKAREFRDRIRESNELAGQQIFQNQNRGNTLDTIDLHGLHVKEAVAAVEGTLRQHKELRRKHGNRLHYRYLTIITGAGRHSIDGKARVREAIEHYLAREKLVFRRVLNGCIKVSLASLK